MSTSIRDEWVSKDGRARLILGDCRYALASLSVGDADCVVTDPPWGLGELSGTTSKERNRNAYEGYDDTEDNIREVVIPAITSAMRISSGRALVFTGCRCMWLYPRPRAIGGFHQPAAVGMSPWGFAGFNPVLFYGKDPRDGKGQSSVMATLTERASTDKHPCAKPIGAMRWAVEKGTLEAETVLDPFMGSGTTGVAAVSMGRRFVGIEIAAPYFHHAKERIERALCEGDSCLPFTIVPELVLL